MQGLGASIRAMRKKRGFTQKRLAELLNISDTIISKYEKDQAVPPLETLCRMSTIFRISLDELCGLGSPGTLSVAGLTDEQTEILSHLTELFRHGERKRSEFSPDQYEILGKIVVEFAKR